MVLMLAIKTMSVPLEAGFGGFAGSLSAIFFKI
jgi:hypothetical protein